MIEGRPNGSFPEYHVWKDAKSRCSRRTHRGYPRYGGRGIRVCERWLNSFENFYADMGPRPSSRHSIDRIDNDGNYEPGNCRWATRREQNNNRSVCVYVAFNGETKTITEWADACGVDKTTMHRKITRGIPLHRALVPKNTHAPIVKHTLTFNGITMSACRWAKSLGLSNRTVTSRLRRGLPPSDVLFQGRLPRGRKGAAHAAE